MLCRYLIWSYLQHKDQFIEGGHYYELTPEELKNIEKRYPQEFVDCISPYLWTFEGMYKHAQLLTGLEAWRAYMSFVYLHFQQSEELKRAVTLLEKASKQIEDMYILLLTKRSGLNNEREITSSRGTITNLTDTCVKTWPQRSVDFATTSLSFVELTI